MVERMTAAELNAALAAPKAAQRAGGDNAKTTYVDGVRFPSKIEANRWVYLRYREKAGEITDLKRQVNIKLLGRDGNILTPTGRDMVYRADFVYYENRQMVVEDTKGHASDIYLLKKAILAAQGVDIVEIR